VAKHEALLAWAAAFKRLHAREPIVFIDRYCLDQNDIPRSLVCLPVLVAGCRRCVVLRGPTLLARLWCLVEIFVFLAMGGSSADIDVVPFGGAPDISSARTTDRDASTREIFHSRHDGRFDARRATCALAADYLTLTSVIDAFPGGVHALNGALLNALRDGEARWRAQETESVATSARAGYRVHPIGAGASADEAAVPRGGVPHHIARIFAVLGQPIAASAPERGV
jgi:hypothetical protein